MTSNSRATPLDLASNLADVLDYFISPLEQVATEVTLESVTSSLQNKTLSSSSSSSSNNNNDSHDSDTRDYDSGLSLASTMREAGEKGTRPFSFHSNDDLQNRRNDQTSFSTSSTSSLPPPQQSVPPPPPPPPANRARGLSMMMMMMMSPNMGGMPSNSNLVSLAAPSAMMTSEAESISNSSTPSSPTTTPAAPPTTYTTPALHNNNNPSVSASIDGVAQRWPRRKSVPLPGPEQQQQGTTLSVSAAAIPIPPASATTIPSMMTTIASPLLLGETATSLQNTITNNNSSSSSMRLSTSSSSQLQETLTPQLTDMKRLAYRRRQGSNFSISSSSLAMHSNNEGLANASSSSSSFSSFPSGVAASPLLGVCLPPPAQIERNISIRSISSSMLLPPQVAFSSMPAAAAATDTGAGAVIFDTLAARPRFLARGTSFSGDLGGIGVGMTAGGGAGGGGGGDATPSSSVITFPSEYYQEQSLSLLRSSSSSSSATAIAGTSQPSTTQYPMLLPEISAEAGDMALWGLARFAARLMQLTSASAATATASSTSTTTTTASGSSEPSQEQHQQQQQSASLISITQDDAMVLGALVEVLHGSLGYPLLPGVVVAAAADPSSSSSSSLETNTTLPPGVGHSATISTRANSFSASSDSTSSTKAVSAPKTVMQKAPSSSSSFGFSVPMLIVPAAGGSALMTNTSSSSQHQQQKAGEGGGGSGVMYTSSSHTGASNTAVVPSFASRTSFASSTSSASNTSGSHDGIITQRYSSNTQRTIETIAEDSSREAFVSGKNDSTAATRNDDDDDTNNDIPRDNLGAAVASASATATTTGSNASSLSTTLVPSYLPSLSTYSSSQSLHHLGGSVSTASSYSNLYAASGNGALSRGSGGNGEHGAVSSSTNTPTTTASTAAGNVRKSIRARAAAELGKVYAANPDVFDASTREYVESLVVPMMKASVGAATGRSAGGGRHLTPTSSADGSVATTGASPTAVKFINAATLVGKLAIAARGFGDAGAIAQKKKAEEAAALAAAAAAAAAAATAAEKEKLGLHLGNKLAAKFDPLSLRALPAAESAALEGMEEWDWNIVEANGKLLKALGKQQQQQQQQQKEHVSTSGVGKGGIHNSLLNSHSHHSQQNPVPLHTVIGKDLPLSKHDSFIMASGASIDASAMTPPQFPVTDTPIHQIISAVENAGNDETTDAASSSSSSSSAASGSKDTHDDYRSSRPPPLVSSLLPTSSSSSSFMLPDNGNGPGAEILVALTSAAVEKLGILEDLGLDAHTVACFMAHIARGYHLGQPYHNALHAADVTQGVYHVLTTGGLARSCAAPARLALLLSAAVHDVGHPGVNNAYLVATCHPLALSYNDASPLENMHAATAFLTMRKPGADVFAPLSTETRASVRALMIYLVLGTDNALHFKKCAKLKRRLLKAMRPPSNGSAGASTINNTNNNRSSNESSSSSSSSATAGDKAAESPVEEEQEDSDSEVDDQVAVAREEAQAEEEAKKRRQMMKERRRLLRLRKRSWATTASTAAGSASISAKSSFQDSSSTDLLIAQNAVGEAQEEEEEEEEEGDYTTASAESDNGPRNNRSNRRRRKKRNDKNTSGEDEAQQTEDDDDDDHDGVEEYNERHEQQLLLLLQEQQKENIIHQPIDMSRPADARLVLASVLHACDISNPSRPWIVSNYWNDWVVDEFHRQGDKMKDHGLLVPPMHDRHHQSDSPTLQRISRLNMAVGFTTVLVLPLWTSLSDPVFHSLMNVEPVMLLLQQNLAKRRSEVEDAKRAAAAASAAASAIA